MPTKDDFDSAHPLPQFLVERDIDDALDEAVPPSRVFKAGILVVTAAAAGIAVLAAGDPTPLLAWGTAALFGNSTPAIQSTADAPALIPSTTDAQASPPPAGDPPASAELAASETSGKDQTENSPPPSEALFKQFQAWAAERETQARAEPAQPVQDAPAQVAQNAPAQKVAVPDAENVRVPDRLVQKRRHVRAVHNARAEMRTQNLRRHARRAQRARAERPPMQAERPPVQDARAQAMPAQNAEAPPFLPPFFGLRN